jgi:hypothetical protein
VGFHSRPLSIERIVHRADELVAGEGQLGVAGWEVALESALEGGAEGKSAQSLGGTEAEALERHGGRRLG